MSSYTHFSPKERDRIGATLAPPNLRPASRKASRGTPHHTATQKDFSRHPRTTTCRSQGYEETDESLDRKKLSFYREEFSPDAPLLPMPLALDIVRYAGEQHVRRGHSMDRPGEKQDIVQHFVDLGAEPERVRSSMEAIAPECLCIARCLWWLTPFHPTKLKIYEDRIVLVRRFLWFKRWRRQERAFMIRHVREVESDFGILSACMVFRSHRGNDICCVRCLRKRDERKTTRIIQALIHEELLRGREQI